MWSPRSFHCKVNKEGVKRESFKVGDPLYNCKSSRSLVDLVTHVKLSMSSQVSQPYRAMKIYKLVGSLTTDEVDNDHIQA